MQCNGRIKQAQKSTKNRENQSAILEKGKLHVPLC